VDGISGTSDTQTCNYLYDDAQRVSSANCGTPWSQTFTYDSFGNISKSGTSTFLPVYSSSTNQFASIPGVNVRYDANGELLTDNLNTYTWNVYSNPITVNSTSLIYDAFGQMVEQQNGSAYTEILYSPVGKTALMNGQTLSKAFVNLPGGATAIYNSTGLAYYRHSDWLGSSRLTSTQARTRYSSSAYAPFGEQYKVAGTSDASFTGQNADTATSLYDFIFREHSPSQGRWISPDPAGVAAVDPTDPQSWNRYAYVLNNPLALIDPLGLEDAGCFEKYVCTDDNTGGGGGFTFYSNVWADGGISWIFDNGISWAPGPVNVGGGIGGGGGRGGDGAADKGNKNCTLSQRAQMFGNGLLNLGIAGVKITAAAGVEAGTSGIGTALALYGAYSASGNLTTGFIQTVGAFMPNAGQWQQAASVSTAAGSIAGLTTLAVTRGNVSAATNASRWEGIFLFGVRGGATGNPPNPVGTVGTAIGAGKLVSGSKSGC
jgi:RHS repeat-associated protein